MTHPTAPCYTCPYFTHFGLDLCSLVDCFLRLSVSVYCFLDHNHKLVMLPSVGQEMHGVHPKGNACIRLRCSAQPCLHMLQTKWSRFQPPVGVFACLHAGGMQIVTSETDAQVFIMHSLLVWATETARCLVCRQGRFPASGRMEGTDSQH